MMKENRGFTLVELMVALTIFLIILASVFGLYIGATKYVAFMEAKSEMLNSVGMIYDLYRPYFFGAVAIYDPNNLDIGDLFVTSNTLTLDSIEFYTKLRDSEGVPLDAWVLITSTTTGRYVYIDGVCQPQKRVVIYRKLFDDLIGKTYIDEKPDMDKWSDWLKSDPTNTFVTPIVPIVGGDNALSTVSIKYYPYSARINNANLVWRRLSVRITVGVQQEVYAKKIGNRCEELISRYPVSLYPYTVEFSITSKNNQ